MLDKTKRILILVESPEKSRTITKIFKESGYNKVIVLATIGHFTKIADGSGYFNTGIHPDDSFKIDYIIDDSKKENIRKLKEQVKAADFVYIASDGDREGEAIAWSCKQFLNIPKSKYKRITYHEITKTSIFKAIEEAHEIDENLVEAAHARAALDKLIGYPLSSHVRKKLKCKSTGRCKGAALRMICNREREIQAFVPEKYIDLYLLFTKNKTQFKAKYQGTTSKKIDSFKDMSDIQAIAEECRGHDFYIYDISKVDRKQYPAPPFCTATFQQECANKLHLKPEDAMAAAQKLFETGKISYMRTDDEVMDKEFASDLLSFVKAKYGKEYAASSVKEGKKDENAQAGHECLRVLDLNLTPDKLEDDLGPGKLAQVYRIIYNRTIASAMNPTIISVTTYTIANGKHRFAMNSNELRFDGYRKIYSYKDDSDEKNDLIRETFEKNEILKECAFDPQAKETQPPKRYKDAGFIQKLKDEGVGRPSTYAELTKAIKSEDWGYVKVENGYLVPTERGMELDKYCINNFNEFLTVEYTADMEKCLDLIGNGKTTYEQFLVEVFGKLDSLLKQLGDTIDEKAIADKKCPKCGKPLVARKGKFGPFLACSGFPKCKYIENINKK